MLKEELITIINNSTDARFIQYLTDCIIKYNRGETTTDAGHTKSNPSWREDAPSEKQLNLIRSTQEKHGLDRVIPKTKGEACDMIDRYLKFDFSTPPSTYKSEVEDSTNEDYPF